MNLTFLCMFMNFRSRRACPRDGPGVARWAAAAHGRRMEFHDRPRAVHVGAAADGTLTYLIDLPPEALPPVRLRDLANAWEAARQAAIAAGHGAATWGVARLFRFRREDGTCTDLALADR
ncbi:MAG: hypothetical protein JO326_06985, partial [Acetobacteraceae bacterium]|nr:hypothetical protein [Acetobacteraceae bacterium]